MRFNPRAPCGARPRKRSLSPPYRRFNPRAPCGARPTILLFLHCNFCFNPRAPCGARLPPMGYYTISLCFNPRAPCGARRGAPYRSFSCSMFQSTRPVRGATHTMIVWFYIGNVSIHAPRAGRDDVAPFELPFPACFNPRAPCGARLHLHDWYGRFQLFQSTRPVRGATTLIRFRRRIPYVSIHAPRAGRDPWYKRKGGSKEMFQSTRPVRGATRDSNRRCGRNRCFNPRAPCGARHVLLLPIELAEVVSIHAPRAGRDWIFA